MVETILQDVRFALRRLARSPGFTAVTVLTLALGIGATTAIASLVYGVLLRPLPYEEPDRLVQVAWHFEEGEANDSLSTSEYVYWKEHARVFAKAGAYEGVGGFNLETGSGARYVRGQRVGDGLFAVLGVQPFLGREFTPEETRPGGPPVALLAYGLWREGFGADAQILGRTIRVNGTAYSVVGVMPRGFQFGAASPELWLPLALRPDARDRGHNTSMIARLAPGVTLQSAQADMPRLLADFRREVPGHVQEPERGAWLVPYRQTLVAEVRPALGLLSLAVALVMLIALVNTMGMFLGRAAARDQEIAVRAALGAGRWALARPLVAEGVILALAGGVAGTLMACWMLDLVVAASPRELPPLAAVQFDLPVLAAAFALSLVTGLAVGVVPALRGRTPDLRGSQQASDRGLGGARQMARSLLVATEVALSVVLLAAALLLLSSLSSLWAVQPGLEPAQVSVIQMSLPPEKFATAETTGRFQGAVRERLARLPGVTSVASASSPPFERGLNDGVTGVKDGRPFETSVETRLVSPRYFETLGIPILQGRTFGAADSRRAGAPVVVVSAALARVYWPNGDAVGRTLGQAEVIGVVGDVRTFGFDRAAPPLLYVPTEQASDSATQAINRWFISCWFIKSARPLDLRTVASAVAEIDPSQPVASIRTMDEVMATSLGPRRFLALLLELFAGCASLLAAVGIYGLVSFVVGRRRREIGLRVALGAAPPDIARLVLGQAVGLSAAGGVVGIAGSLVLSRFLRSFLFGVQASDPRILALAAGTLIAVALLASSLPVRRATLDDPMAALRSE